MKVSGFGVFQGFWSGEKVLLVLCILQGGLISNASSLELLELPLMTPSWVSQL